MANGTKVTEQSVVYLFDTYALQLLGQTKMMMMMMMKRLHYYHHYFVDLMTSLGLD